MEAVRAWLKEVGHSVVTDADNLNNGEPWRVQIHNHLVHCSAVIVLWSKNSVQSDEVKFEAAFGLLQGRYVPVVLEAGTKLPTPFADIQATKLNDRDLESLDNPNAEHLLKALHEKTGKLARPDPLKLAQDQAQKKKRRTVWWAAGAVSAASVVFAAGVAVSALILMRAQSEQAAADPAVQTAPLMKRPESKPPAAFKAAETPPAPVPASVTPAPATSEAPLTTVAPAREAPVQRTADIPSCSKVPNAELVRLLSFGVAPAPEKYSDDDLKCAFEADQTQARHAYHWLGKRAQKASNPELAESYFLKGHNARSSFASWELLSLHIKRNNAALDKESCAINAELQKRRDYPEHKAEIADRNKACKKEGLPAR
jgi:hypothetical protein